MGWLFPGVAESIVGLLLCCVMGIVQCLSILRHLVIAPVRNNKKLPMGDSPAADVIRRRDVHAHDDYRYPYSNAISLLEIYKTLPCQNGSTPGRRTLRSVWPGETTARRVLQFHGP